MGKLLFEAQVRDALRGRPYLIPVFRDVCDISRRLREVDETLFVVFNTASQQFEVHSLEHRPDTCAWAVPFDQLDERTVRLARRNSLRMRGDAIFREMDEHNEKLEASMRRRRRNEIDAWARDAAHKLFRKTAYWE